MKVSSDICCMFVSRSFYLLTVQYIMPYAKITLWNIGKFLYGFIIFISNLSSLSSTPHYLILLI